MSNNALWASKLCGRYESKVTLYWKFAFLNRVPAKEKLLLPPSLPGLGDCQSYDDLPRGVRAGPHLRYCATCLMHGYVSHFFQLAGLAQCPIHKERLLEHCRCGAPMPWLAGAEQVGRRTPFHCEYCKRPFASRFDPHLFFEAPQAIHAHESVFEPFASWLQRIKQGWIEWSFESELDDAPEAMKRTTVTWILMGLERLDCDTSLLGGKPIPLCASSFRPRQSQYDDRKVIAEHQSLYRAIRRRLSRRTASLPGCGRFKKLMRTATPPLRLRAKVPAAVAAFIRWRAEMELPEDPTRARTPGRAANGRFNGHNDLARTPILTNYAQPLRITDDLVAPIAIWGRFIISTYAAMRTNQSLPESSRWQLPWPRRLSLVRKGTYYSLLHHQVGAGVPSAVYENENPRCLVKLHWTNLGARPI